MSRRTLAVLAVVMCIVGGLWLLWVQPPLLMTAGVLLGSLMLLVGCVVSRQ